MNKLAFVGTVALMGAKSAAATASPWVVSQPTTTNCNVQITQQMLTEECGYSVDKPCWVKRNGPTTGNPPEAGCGRKYIVSHEQPSSEPHYSFTPNRIYVQVVAVEDGIPTEFEFGQTAWQLMCPFQCGSNTKCEYDPALCEGQNISFDFIENGVVIPGSAKSGVKNQQLQWMSLNASGVRDNIDDSTATNLVAEGGFHIHSIFGQPQRMTAATAACDGHSFRFDDVTSSACGSTNKQLAQRACNVASSVGACGECYEVTIQTPGLQDVNSSTPEMCKGGACPDMRVKKIIKTVSRPVNATDTIPRSVHFANGLWSSSDVCPVLCTHPSGYSICVPDAALCVNTPPVNVTVAAAGGWGEYTEMGSMALNKIGIFVGGKVACPADGASRAVAGMFGGLVLAAVAALMM